MTVSPASPRLRVLRIIARMNVGGPARQVAVLAEHLDVHRFEQRLLIGTTEPGEADDMVLRSVELPHERIRGLGRAVSPVDDARALAALVAEVRRFQPHIVHTHTAKAGAVGRLAALLARTGMSRRPALVHTFHGHLLHGYFSPAVTAGVVAVERALASRTDRLVAVGSRVRNELVAAGIGRHGHWDVVEPAMSVRPFPDRHVARAALGLPEGLPVVAFVARLTRVKRPDRFADVAARVLQSHPTARFVVAGGGELEEELAVSCRRRGIAGAVDLLGWRADVEAVYSAADVVLLTSDNEGMPVSLIEAALAGRPVVAPDVGSVAEVVADGVTGVVTGTEAGQLSAAVCRLLGDPLLRETMGHAAARLATERFAPARLAGDMDRIYSEIAAERGW